MYVIEACFSLMRNIVMIIFVTMVFFNRMPYVISVICLDTLSWLPFIIKVNYYKKIHMAKHVDVFLLIHIIMHFFFLFVMPCLILCSIQNLQTIMNKFRPLPSSSFLSRILLPTDSHYVISFSIKQEYHCSN